MEDLNSFLFVRVLKETLRYLPWHGNLRVSLSCQSSENMLKKREIMMAC